MRRKNKYFFNKKRKIRKNVKKNIHFISLTWGQSHASPPLLLWAVNGGCEIVFVVLAVVSRRSTVEAKEVVSASFAEKVTRREARSVSRPWIAIRLSSTVRLKYLRAFCCCHSCTWNREALFSISILDLALQFDNNRTIRKNTAQRSLWQSSLVAFLVGFNGIDFIFEWLNYMSGINF